MSRRRARQKNHRAGIMAEYLALLWLLVKGYMPVAMRYKTPVGEIDIVARRGRTLVFVEVKLRKTVADAAHAVHQKNQSRVLRAAQYFLNHYPRYADHTVRFDVCLIPWYRLPLHIPQAFDAQ